VLQSSFGPVTLGTCCMYLELINLVSVTAAMKRGV
jgi:hypothetical protein